MILDLLINQNKPKTIELSDLYPDATEFSIATEDNAQVNALIDGTTLTLAPGALGHADLALSFRDADGVMQTDPFRAIVAGENAYSFAIIPDTQSYTSSADPEIQQLFGEMMDYIVDHKDALGIIHAIHVGDIVEFGAENQWRIAEDAIERLDGNVSYTLGVGNHDQQRPGFASAFSFESDIDTYFTPEQNGATAAQGGGTYDGFDVGEDTFNNGDTYSDSIRNNYTTVSAPDGTDWLILSLEFGAPDDVLRWAGEVIEEHLDHRVIIDTHSWNGGDKRVDPTTEPLTGENGGWGYGIRENPRNVNDGEDMWREFASKYPNITFTFNGHNFLDGAETAISEATGENDVFQMFVNYQNGISGEITGAGDASLGGRGGNGGFRLVVIDPDNDQITTHAKFTGLDRFFERVDHQETFAGVDLGTPEQLTLARAGDTRIIEAQEDGTATVTLDPAASVTPGDAGAVIYEWTASDGESLGATDGAALEADLGYGVHRVTLTATDADGNVSSDDTTIIVEGPENLLTDTFDDGNLDGWTGPTGAAEFFDLGTETDFSLMSIDGTGQIAMELSFDSSFRPYDDMTGEVGVSFDGGETFSSLLTLNTGTVPGGTSSLSRVNEQVSIGFLAPAGAEGITVSWRLSDGGNDWWWAFDNVELSLTGSTENIFAEDFDGLAGTLQPAVDENIPGGTLGFTHTPPEGWTFEVSDGTPEGTTEWQGWSFTTPEFWTAADGQNRGDFTLGTGVIAVADTDEWDDFNAGTQTGGDFDTTVATPSIDISAFTGDGVAGEPAQIARIDPLTPTQALRVSTAAPNVLDAYTLIFDIYIAGDAANSFTSLYQTGAANDDDAEFYIRADGGIGTFGQYDGNFQFDAWNRLAISVRVEGDTQVMDKYIDGALVGTQTVDTDITDGSRYTIDLQSGLQLFGEPAGFTSELYVNAVGLTPEVLDVERIAALGGVDVDGPLSGTDAGAIQLGFDGAIDDVDFGDADVMVTDTSATSTAFLAKGSIFGNPDGVGEAAAYVQNDGADERLIWRAPEALDWSDYVLEFVVEPADNDTIGALFYYQDEDNHYALEIDQQNFTRTLMRVSGGVETVLAAQSGAYAHFQEQDLRIAVGPNGIAVTLDEELLFDGPVIDDAPLPGGTIGLLSGSMDRVSFDDVSVNGQVLQAVALGDRRAVDVDGDGMETLSLTAAASVTPAAVTYEWLIDDAIVASGRDVDIDIATGRSDVTLRITDGNDAVSEDTVAINVVAQGAVLLAENFDAPENDFTIVDQGTIDAPSGWSVTEGAFVQGSDISSDQQETGFGAWSLGGEGAYILREGTFAVYEGGGTWDDYAVEVSVTPGDDDGLGMLFRYQDADNFYKFELDEQTGTAQLIRNEDGYETVLARGWSGYAPGEQTTLRIEAEGTDLTAYIDGVRAFGSDVTDDTFSDGTVALYAWASEDLSFDDILVTQLGDGPAALARITGTEGRDTLIGTQADEVFEFLVGADVIRPGGGNDVLDLSSTVGNGTRDSLIVHAEAGQSLAFAGLTDADIAATSARGDRVVYRLTEDRDTITVTGLDPDDIQFIDDFMFV